MVTIRQQLPVYSPVSGKATFAAAAQLLNLGTDPRPALRSLVAREYSSKSVILCGSGTQALTLAIEEARTRVDANALVALPAFSCFDVASAAVGAGVRVNLYDLDPNTLAPDLVSLERTLKAGAGVVVVAPLYGIPVDWDSLRELAARYGSVLIEDAAQGHGASWRGEPLGALGEISVLSFGRGKGWTGGNGGAVLIRGARPPANNAATSGSSSAAARTVISLIAQWAMARPRIYGLPASIPALHLGETTYLPPREPSVLSRASAAALLATHSAAKAEAKARRKNAESLVLLLRRCKNATVISGPSGATPGYLRLPIRVQGGRSALAQESRAARLGIAPSYPIPLSELAPLANSLAGAERSWPGARVLARDLVTLPTHSRLRSSDLQEIAALFGGAAGSDATRGDRALAQAAEEY
jgi:perosamine synthetase